MKLVAFTLDELGAYFGSDDVPGNSIQLSDLDGFSIALAAGSAQGSTPPYRPVRCRNRRPIPSDQRRLRTRRAVLLPPLESPPPIRSSQ
jgi:hypothetical protein